MAKKLETVKLVASMEKAARKTKKPLWGTLAEIIEHPSRHQIAVNLTKLNKIAAASKGKILVVPGKILSTGEFTEKATIVAVAASAVAKQKMKGKAEFTTLAEFAKKFDKVDASKVIIVG
ncbi:50S ribosomal protein L18e [uncultured archaeon]|nr:50S ribosomal protein L18e [uncultured archaeon]